MKYIFTILLSTITLTLFSQQSTNNSLYMFNEFRWNPAYAGLDHSLSVTGLYRGQWVGGALKDVPSTQMLSAHLPLYVLNGGGGLTV